MAPKRFLLTLLVAQAASLSSAGFWDGVKETNEEQREAAEIVLVSDEHVSTADEPLEYGVDIVSMTGIHLGSSTSGSSSLKVSNASLLSFPTFTRSHSQCITLKFRPITLGYLTMWTPPFRLLQSTRT